MTALRRHILRRQGSRLMATYVRSVESIGCGFTWAETRYVERLSPTVRRYRLRAKACARLLGRAG